MACVFCNIRDKEPKKFIRETENTFTILSNPFLTEGHSLVIPKLHVEKLSELSPEVRSELLNEVVGVQDLVLKNLKSPGADIRQNFRPFLPESRVKVNHLHFHIIPRSLRDVLYQKSMIHEKEIFTFLTPELNDDIMEKFR